MLPAINKSPSKKTTLWEWLTAQDTEPEEAMIHDMIRETRANIEMCRRNYEFTNDETLIDMYIYSIKAYEMQYKYLLKIAKRMYEESLEA